MSMLKSSSSIQKKQVFSSSPPWRDLQARFAHAVIHTPDLGQTSSLWSDGPGLGVYHNTIVHGQVDALAHVFPEFQQLVGEECFLPSQKIFLKVFLLLPLVWLSMEYTWQTLFKVYRLFNLCRTCLI